MSGHVGNLSSEQERILREFKEDLLDIHKEDFDDYFYTRWLRARNFDKAKSEMMLRKNISWRKKIGADTMIRDYKPPEVLEKFYPRALLGCDKEGSPVRYLPFKYLDYKGYSMALPRTEVVKFLTFCYEEETNIMKKQSERLCKVIEKSTYILDIEGYTFRQATCRQSVETLNTLLRVFEANYPERLKVAYFINAPAYFSMVLALSTPFLSEATLSKFKVFGSDNFREFLPKVIDAHVLPVFLGGSRTDPDGDPLCRTIINYGDFVPKSYYYARDHQFADEPGVKTLTIERRSSQLVEVDIEEPGSQLQWEVESSNNDIAIGLFYKTSCIGKTKSNLECILPIDRVECHLVRESCVHHCDRFGTYVLKFDNSYSFLFSKKIFYKITIVRPGEVDDE